MSKITKEEQEWLDNAEESQRRAWLDEHAKQLCPCSKHDCRKVDEYVEQGFHCEDCFRECVETGD